MSAVKSKTQSEPRESILQKLQPSPTTSPIVQKEVKTQLDYKLQVANAIIYLNALKQIVEDLLESQKAIWKKENFGDLELWENGPGIKLTTRNEIKLNPLNILALYRNHASLFAQTANILSEEQLIYNFFEVKPEFLKILEELKQHLPNLQIEPFIKEVITRPILNTTNLEQLPNENIKAYALLNVLADAILNKFKEKKIKRKTTQKNQEVNENLTLAK